MKNNSDSMEFLKYVIDLEDMLTRLEWVFKASVRYRYCPVCNARQDQGHTKSCELDALLTISRTGESDE